MKAGYYKNADDSMEIDMMLFICDRIGEDEFIKACLETENEDVIGTIEDSLTMTQQELMAEPWYTAFWKFYNDFCDIYLLKEDKLPF